MEKAVKVGTLKSLSACGLCTDVRHRLKDCRSPIKCRECSESHMTEFHEVRHLLSFTVSTSSKFSSKCRSSNSGVGVNCDNNVRMSIQDVPIEKFGSSSELARIMWDNGCEAALVTFAFAEKSCFPFIQKKYLIAGVGSEPRVIEGKLYTIDLID